MAKQRILITASIILIVVVASVTAYEVGNSQHHIETVNQTGTLFQVSSYYSLATGNYEGVLSYSELETHGDFGIGTFNDMDGEMIAVNGVFYQIRTNGIPRIVNASLTSPFAMLTFFKVDQTVQVEAGLNYSELTAYIDSVLPNQNGIYAIKIRGTYDYAKTRSVPIQSKPYPLLTVVVGNQTVFNLTDISGSAVGFRCPDFMNGTDVPGYHLHFITDDHNAGGHLLDCIGKNVTVEISYIDTFEMAVPPA